MEYVKIKTFLCRFFTLEKLLNDILKKVVKYGTSSDHLIFDKHIILVGYPTSTPEVNEYGVSVESLLFDLFYIEW